MATQAYWRLLLTQVKPLPRFFFQLDFAIAATTAKVGWSTYGFCPLRSMLRYMLRLLKLSPKDKVADSRP